MGWYVVIKAIKGHRYRYRQRTWREGDHVRTESIYLGPVGGGRSGNARGRDSRPSRDATGVEREALHAGQFSIPVGAKRQSGTSQRNAETKLEKILRRRQEILAKHAAGKLSAAQFARRMKVNEEQYLKHQADEC